MEDGLKYIFTQVCVIENNFLSSLRDKKIPVQNADEYTARTPKINIIIKNPIAING